MLILIKNFTNLHTLHTSEIRIYVFGNDSLLRLCYALCSSSNQNLINHLKIDADEFRAYAVLIKHHPEKFDILSLNLPYHKKYQIVQFWDFVPSASQMSKRLKSNEPNQEKERQEDSLRVACNKSTFVNIMHWKSKRLLNGAFVLE